MKVSVRRLLRKRGVVIRQPAEVILHMLAYSGLMLSLFQVIHKTKLVEADQGLLVMVVVLRRHAIGRRHVHQFRLLVLLLRSRRA